MTDKQLDAFKNRMRNYAFLKESIEELQEELEIKWYDLTGVKGISFDRTAGTTNQLQKDLNKLKGYEEVEELEKKIKEKQTEVDKLDAMLNQLPAFEKHMCIQKFVHNYSYYDLSAKCYMDRTTIKRKLDKALSVVEYL